MQELCNKNTVLVLPDDFFSDLPKNVSLYAFRKIISSIQSQKELYIQEKNNLIGSSRTEVSLLEIQKAKLQKYIEKKEELLQELSKIEKEIQDIQFSISNEQEKIKRDEEKVKDIESIYKTLEDSLQHNQKLIESFTKEMRDWASSKKNQNIKDLSSDDIFYLLAAMDVDYDTKKMLKGSELLEIGGHSPLKNWLNWVNCLLTYCM